MTTTPDAPPLTPQEYQLAATVTPGLVTAYLAATGWRPERRFGRGELWTYGASAAQQPTTWGLHALPGARAPDENTAEEPFEALVSLDPSLRDYPQRMVDLLEAVAAVEQRAATDVLHEIVAPADTQYLGLQPPTPSGTAPLDDVVSAVSGLRDAMFAAAGAVLAKRPLLVQPPQRQQRAQAFVRAVRLGPTRAGSYILSVRTPLRLPEESPQSELPLDGLPRPDRTPFERQVSAMLCRGVQAAHDAATEARETGDFRVFERYGQQQVGLSANLCEALADVGGPRQHPFRIWFAWSRLLPMAFDTPEIAFTAPLLEVLAHAARDLRDRMGQPDVTVRGTITKLHRVPTHGPGEITVLGYLLSEPSAGPRSFRVHLAADDYAQANAAHSAGLLVEVRGDLRLHGSRKHIETVREFRVRDDD